MNELQEQSVRFMVLILDGNLEIGAHLCGVKFDLLKAYGRIDSSCKFEIYFQKRQIFLRTCATCSEIPFNISILV